MECWCVFTLIGVLWVCKQLLDFLLFLWRRNQSLEGFKHGWAVVTGATDGIGKAISAELLSKGFKVALVSRSQTKLQTVQAEFQQRFPSANIAIIAVDFAEGMKDVKGFYRDVGKKLETLGDISVLVNNVGLMHWKQFDKTSFEEIEEMIAVNILPQTFLTRIVLPGMCERLSKAGQRSLVINLSSNASILPLPCLSVYGATKAYNDYLSQTLGCEVPSGITMLSVLPGMVATNMPKSNNIPLQPGSVSSQACARQLLQNVGQGSTGGHYLHMALGWTLRHLLNNPFGRLVVNKSARDIMKQIEKNK